VAPVAAAAFINSVLEYTGCVSPLVLMVMCRHCNKS
jgi:hypothetical protein